MLEKPIALAVGNFDGVHLGHQHLLKTLVLKAKEKNLVPSVLMFDPHPLEVLEKESAPCMIYTIENKIRRQIGKKAKREKSEKGTEKKKKRRQKKSKKKKKEKNIYINLVLKTSL
jgi:hypothetical protein